MSNVNYQIVIKWSFLFKKKEIIIREFYKHWYAHNNNDITINFI